MATTQHETQNAPAADHCAPAPGRKIDWLLTISGSIIIISYGLHLTALGGTSPAFAQFAHSIFEFINTMAWGIALAIVFTGIIGVIPREFVTSVLGRGGTVPGVARAMLAGVLLDLCSHGILIVGSRLYERGASLGQVMAFLIASPWNSLSLTLILWALVGFQWVLTFLLTSMAIAFVAGVIFDRLVRRGRLPDNPNQHELSEDFRFFAEAQKGLKKAKFSPEVIGEVLWNGLKGSRMVMRWMFFGVVLAAGIRVLVAPETFESYFGPTIVGLGLTLIAATIIEVCSEGSVPIAADLLVRAGAPGNSFAFLMTGVSTDYTEIMVLKDVTASWKIALFLPLITVPQVIVMAWLMNQI